MSRSRVKGKCRLCLTETELVDSHVIPDFLYKPLKEEEGVFYSISSDAGKKELKKQKGITEHLLCEVCDTKRLSQYEDQLSRVIFGGRVLDLKEEGRVMKVSGYDYHRLKNGLLSILWRMSISSHTYFSDVTLRSVHAENLRQILLLDSAVGEEEYPILVSAPYFNGKHLGRWMLPPENAPVDGRPSYRCLISGLVFTFFIGTATLDERFKLLILRRDEWPIIRARVEEMPFLLEACLQLGEAMQKRKVPSES